MHSPDPEERTGWRHHTCIVHHRRDILSGRKWGHGRDEINSEDRFSPTQNGQTPDEQSDDCRDHPERTCDVKCNASFVLLANMDPPSFAEDLQRFIRICCFPIYWSPGASSDIHYGVPSGGEIRPLDIYISGEADGDPCSLFLAPEKTALIPVSLNLGDGFLPAADAEFIVVGDLSKGRAIYGELSVVLAAIESGMWVAHFRIAAVALGFRPSSSRMSWTSLFHNGVAGAPSGDHRSVVLRSCTLGGVKISDILAACAWHTDTPDTRPGFSDGSSLLAPAVFRETISVSEPLRRASDPVILPPPLTAEAVMKAIFRRTSGAEGPKILPYRFDRHALVEFMRSAHALIMIAIDDPTCLDHVRVRIAIRYPQDGTRCDLVEFDVRPDANIPDVPMTVRDFSAHGLSDILAGECPRCIICIGIDDVTLSNTQMPAMSVESYQVAGQIGQALCLCASVAGLSARPLRSFDQAASDGFLPITHRTILQIEIGAVPPRFSGDIVDSGI